MHSIQHDLTFFLNHHNMGWYMFRFTRTNKDYTFIVVTCGYTETYDLIYHYHCLQDEPDKPLAKHVQVCYIYIEKKIKRYF